MNNEEQFYLACITIPYHTDHACLYSVASRDSHSTVCEEPVSKSLHETEESS